jgi:single-stranded-DNA-specific exonuclease
MDMRVEKQWRIMAPDRAASEALARQFGISPITAQVLLNRRVIGEPAVRAFLHPDLNQLHDPSCMPEMEIAARRIREAVEGRRKIAVYGDYDVDGASATAILLHCLRLLGADPEFYVPDRLEEGYGLNAAAIRKLAEVGTQLLVTVDCGITAVEEIALAQRLGMEVIVTDHHEAGEVVPSGATLIDPKLPGCVYPFRELSGAGLALKLAWAIGKDFSSGRKVSPVFREFLVDSLSLAALGTIADVVPLRDENRTIACFGVRGLSASSSPGIKALREAAGLPTGAGEKGLDAWDVAFKLAPRLNAAGRLGSARDAVELLTTSSAERAAEIAAGLNRENARRQKMQEKILAESQEMIAREGGIQGRCSIVLSREGWHAGVIGVVAARLVEQYWRPTVLLAVEEDMGHGSARSIAAMNLFECLRECSGRLIGFGGHARAAGLRLRKNEIERFREEFERAAARRLSAGDLEPFVEADAEVRLPEITRPLLDELDRLAPFGEGNREPLLAALNVEAPSGATYIGDGRHLAFWVRQNGATFRAVAFNQGRMAGALSAKRACSLLFVPRLNRWRGEAKIELEVREIRVG